MPKEENPALGIRAIRLCLNRPEIFRTQLRALFRASAFGNLGIMFPMIANEWEIDEIKRICGDVRKELKEKGIWVYCADMDGTCWCQQDYNGPVGLVIGSEGNGIGRLVKEKCDFIVSLPMKGNITSLNASVAAGVLMYEVVRKRNLK